jgi:hypothetical protein
MQLSTEAEIVQNSALSAVLIWAFALEFNGQTKGVGPSIPITLLVLPMALHKETVKALHRRNYEGGLDLALSENRLLTVDLHERVQAMAGQTMRALDLAFATRLLNYDREASQIIPLRKTDPFREVSPELRYMLQTATRLGYWLSTINIERIGSLLRVHL